VLGHVAVEKVCRAHHLLGAVVKLPECDPTRYAFDANESLFLPLHRNCLTRKKFFGRIFSDVQRVDNVRMNNVCQVNDGSGVLPDRIKFSQIWDRAPLVVNLAGGAILPADFERFLRQFWSWKWIRDFFRKTTQQCCVVILLRNECIIQIGNLKRQISFYKIHETHNFWTRYKTFKCNFV